MTLAFQQWADSFVALIRGTTILWWRLAARLAAILAVSWTVSRVLQLGASAMGIMVASREYDIDVQTGQFDVRTVALWNQWAAIVLVSLSLLALLTGLIMCLRVFGDHLTGRSALPAKDDEVGPSLVRVLSLSLLAFLGIYTVFDGVQDIVNRVISDALMLNRDPMITLFTPLMPDSWQQTLIVVGVIVAAFLLRRMVEQRADKTGSRLLGLLSAVLESFYLFAFFIVGRGLLLKLRAWLVYRTVSSWWQDAIAWLGQPLAWIKLSLPDMVAAAWAWIWDVGGPIVLASFTQPLLWLALATLILGSGIKSFGELLEAGDLRTAAARRTRGGQTAMKVVDVVERHGKAARRVQNIALGNIDDKYLPILHVIRLTLRSGIGFLGAFVVAFAFLGLAENWANYGMDVLVGPRDFSTEQLVGNFTQLVSYVVFMSLRLSLLAAAYALAFRARLRGADHLAEPSETAEAAA